MLLPLSLGLVATESTLVVNEGVVSNIGAVGGDKRHEL